MKISEEYNLEIVDNSTDLIGDLLSWEPDFALLHSDDYGDDAQGILKRCSETLRGTTVPFYLFSRDEDHKQLMDELKKNGFEESIIYTGDGSDLVPVLDEIFGVNLIEESIEGDYVVLKRTKAKNPVAGREVIHRIVNKRKEDFSKFVVDITAVDHVSFEELQYLGQVTNYQTRFGVKLCFVSDSEKVSETLRSFHETAGVKVFQNIAEAKEFLE